MGALGGVAGAIVGGLAGAAVLFVWMVPLT